MSARSEALASKSSKAAEKEKTPVGYKPLRTYEDAPAAKHAIIQEVDVHNPRLNYITLFLLAASACVEGFSVDYQARWDTDNFPFWLDAMKLASCMAFSVELSCRIGIKGCSFFDPRKKFWQWHYFQTSLVVAMVTEWFMTASGRWFGWIIQGPTEVRHFLRLYGTLRVLRALHVVDNLEYGGEFHLLMASLFGSLRSLGWAAFFVLCPMFVYAMVLTQAVAMLSEDRGDQNLHQIKHFFGSLDRSMLTLFGSVSGGLSWEDAMIALRTHSFMWLSNFYVLYIGCIVFAVLNVVTGVFVGSATAAADPEKRKAAIISMRRFFHEADSDASGTLDESEFQDMVENSRELQVILQALGIGREQAVELFELLDNDGSGELESDEFIEGVTKFQGPVSAIDFATFRHDFADYVQKFDSHVKRVESHMSREESID